MATSYIFLKILKKKRIKHYRNTMKITNNTLNKCRICLKNGSMPIFNNNECEDLVHAVKAFGQIELQENDGLPNFLCDFCYSLLKGAILFRKTAKETNVRLHSKPSIRAAESFNLTTANEQSNDSASDNDAKNNTDMACYTSYRCKLCMMEFKSYEALVKHRNLKQHRNIRVQCPICFGLLTAQSYKKHLSRHQSASHLVCDVCGKLYRKDNLIRHSQLHNFDLPYQCQVCPYRGRFMESLKIHMRTHSGDRPFSCEKCELRFLTRSNLNRHLLTHKKDKPFKCIECSRVFYTQKDADDHYKSNHAGIKDFSCLSCGNKYGTRKALMRHELRVHKRDKMAKGRIPLYLQEEFKKL